MPLPNFFIAGAPKSGTTSLYHHLDQHPEIFMSPLKEISYFSEEVREAKFGPELRRGASEARQGLRDYIDAGAPTKRFGGIVDDWQDYCSLFAAAGEERAIGEGSVCYLWSRSAPERIAATIPGAKVIVVLRDPVERAFSQYIHALADGALTWSFTEHLDRAFSRKPGDDELNLFHPFLELGMYAEQIRRYRRYFPENHLGMWTYEESLQSNFLSEVFRFLGVDPGFRPDTSERYLQQEIVSVPRIRKVMRSSSAWKRLKSHLPLYFLRTIRNAAYKPAKRLQMSPRDRERLEQYYLPSVRDLDLLLGARVAHWCGRA